MKRVFLPFFLIFSVYCFAQDTKVINDPNAQLRKVTSFEGVEVSGPIDLYFTQSNEAKVAISAKDSEDIQKIETTVEDGILYIRYKKNWSFLVHKFKAYVSCPAVKKLGSSGSGNVYIDGSLKSDNLEIELAGSGNAEGEVNVNQLEVTQSGSSNVRIKGIADKANFTTSGSGNVYAMDLITNYCDITISGSGNAEVTCNKEISGQTSGSGNISYKGTASLQSITSSGSGKFRKVN